MPTKKTALQAEIDRWFKLREKRMALDKKVAALKAEEEQHHDKVLALMNAQGLEKASSALATVSVASKPTIKIEDWPAFLAWVSRNDLEDVVQKRVTLSHLEEHMEARKRLKLPEGSAWDRPLRRVGLRRR